MKKISHLLLILPIILLFAFQNVFALGVISARQDSIFMGQKHNYHVIFRANGEAIVYANIEFSNATDNAMKEYVFESPVDIRDLTIYQYGQSGCNYKYLSGTPELDYSSSAMYPDYCSNLYTKLKFDAEGNKYTVKLAKEVPLNAQGNILLGYSSRKYTNELLGGYDYNFKAFKVNSRIETLRINISVDSDLLLKGASSSVDQIASSSTAMIDANVTGEKAIASQSMDSVLSMINYGTINKSFTQVASDEEVTVSGEYSSNGIRLYAKEISITILIFVLIIASIIVIRKKLPKNTKVQNKISVGINKQEVLMDICWGLISAFIIAVFSVFVTYISNYMYMLNYGSLNGLGHLALVVVSILIYLFVTLAAPIIRGIKRGWVSFVIVISSEIIFLIIMILVFAMIFSTSTIAPYPIY